MNPCRTAFEEHHRWKPRMMKKGNDGRYTASYVRLLYVEWVAAWDAAKEVQQGTIDSLREQLNERRES